MRFWTARRPDIAFDLALKAEDLLRSEGLKDVAYRVIQEGVNNAVSARAAQSHPHRGRTGRRQGPCGLRPG